MKSYLINQNDAGQRVSKFVEKTVPALPPSLLYKYFRLKRIKLNKKRCQPQDRLQEGDLVELYISDEFFGEGRQDLAFLKVPDKLTIIYEDENILLVDKKPGLVVHEDDDNTPDTLINRILHYLYNKGEYNPQAEQSFVPALCNRIDRNTGGIVIAAKNAQALRILNQKVKDRELQKLYLCLVHGVPNPPAATLHDYLIKDSQRNQVRILKKQVPGSRTVITRYRTLKTNGRVSLLEVDLITGPHPSDPQPTWPLRPPTGGGHQIRHHAQNKGSGHSYQALYAYKLRFAFTTDAGILSYLNGKEFRVGQVGFANEV